MDYEQQLASGEGPTEADRATFVAGILELGLGWQAGSETLELGDVRWRPDLTKTGAAVHVSVTGELPKPWRRRLKAAADSGLRPVFATTASVIDVDVLLDLQALDAEVMTADLAMGAMSVTVHRSVADMIADRGLYLDPEALSKLAKQRLDASLIAATNAKKGRWFEEVLCLLFSQVSWLSVEEHAYHNATEEIDLLLSCRAVGYVAELVGGPLVVATAKNEQKATDSQAVKYLKEQMANRRGRCKLGFLCSGSTISDAASGEILRGSQSGDAVIACIDRARLMELIQHTHELDERVEAIIREAIAA